MHISLYINLIANFTKNTMPKIVIIDLSYPFFVLTCKVISYFLIYYLTLSLALSFVTQGGIPTTISGSTLCKTTTLNNTLTSFIIY